MGPKRHDFGRQNVNKQGLVDAVKKLQCWTRYDSKGHRYVNCEEGGGETADHMRARPVSARMRKRLDDMAYDEDSDDIAIKRRRHALDQLGKARRERGLPARAKGGPVSKNKQYVVGEAGPERYVPKGGDGNQCWTRKNSNGGKYVTCKDAQDGRAAERMVGEDGPELFVPDEDGTIVPNERTRKRKAAEEADDDDDDDGDKFRRVTGRSKARAKRMAREAAEAETEDEEDDGDRFRHVTGRTKERQATMEGPYSEPWMKRYKKTGRIRCEGGPVKKGTSYVVGEEGAENYIPGRKHGGPVKKGQKYVVGEDGAERFVPSRFRQNLTMLRNSGITALLGPHGRTVDALLTAAPEAYECARASATFGGALQCALDAALQLYGSHTTSSMAPNSYAVNRSDPMTRGLSTAPPPTFDELQDEPDLR